MSKRSSWPAGHVVHMSLDHSDRAQSISVARCDCGWVSLMPWPGIEHVRAQDVLVETHWQSVDENAAADTYRYGRSPAAAGLDAVREINRLPEDERAAGAAAFVSARLTKESE